MSRQQSVQLSDLKGLLTMKKWKQALACFLTGYMVISTSICAQAAVDMNIVSEIETNNIAGWPQGPVTSSDTAVLMDAATGILLYDKGADVQRYPASITKIMTCLVALENSSLDEEVTFTETGVRNVNADSSNIGTKIGEVITMKDCLYALMLSSANDAAAQIAEHVGGTEQNFIDMMNQRAEEIGCTNTHFTNSSGLPDENQYTSARDMALIFKEGLKNSEFKEIVSTSKYEIQPTDMTGEARTLSNHHPMLAKGAPNYYKGCIGGKTGYTNAAGQTLVTCVKRKKGTYIVVTMHAADIGVSINDTKALLDYGYQNFVRKKVEGGKVLIPKDADVNSLSVKEDDSPDAKGRTVQTYYYGDYYVGSAKTAQITPTSTPTPEPEITESTQTEQEEKQDITEESSVKTIPQFRKILLIIMGVMVLILIILLFALSRKNRRYDHK